MFRTIAKYLLTVGLIAFLASCTDKPSDTSPTPGVSHTYDVEQIQQFCGNCHVLPDADYFPQSMWYQEVQRGFNFYTSSGRSDLSVPQVNDVVAWYRSQAPESLKMTSLLPSETSLSLRREILPAEGAPLVASVNWNSQSGHWPKLRFCDMELGRIQGWSDGKQTGQIANGANISVSRIVDVDQDGQPDLLYCELGSKLPADHALGRLSYRSGKDISAPAVPLAEGVGRIADVSAADFDGDGDLDLIVAEFGWLKTGSIFLLENRRDALKASQPLTAADFERHAIDPRHGTIHVPVIDLNGDGLPDFLALISQEFETVVGFINEGNLQFRKEVIMQPQDPSYGSCSIELTDIDSDGDKDLIYCNGDTLDSHLVKDYHGVHLLLNEGHFPYTMSRLLTLPGASHSATADFDGDGDMDVAVASYLPANLLEQLPTGTYDSLCWLEQTGKLEFAAKSLATGKTGHLGLTMGDFDGNGTVDLAAGDSPGSGWGSIWWNAGTKASAKSSAP